MPPELHGPAHPFGEYRPPHPQAGVDLDHRLFRAVAESRPVAAAPDSGGGDPDHRKGLKKPGLFASTVFDYVEYYGREDREAIKTLLTARYLKGWNEGDADMVANAFAKEDAGADNPSFSNTSTNVKSM